MIFVFIFRSVYCSSIHSLSIISREREVQQCTTWVLNTQPHKTASSKNFWRSKGFCSSCTGQERVTGATSQPASLTSTSTPSYVSLAIVSADNLSFRLDQLPRSLVCIIWATADGQTFQKSTKNSKQIKVIFHFSRLTERLSSAETISRFWII